MENCTLNFVKKICNMAFILQKTAIEKQLLTIYAIYASQCVVRDIFTSYNISDENTENNNNPCFRNQPGLK